MPDASITASLPSRNARARNGESSASARENFTFHGHALLQRSPRVALRLAGKSAIYPAPVAGGSRKRDFEMLTPMIEYRVADEFCLDVGAGLQLDALVF